MSEFSTCEETVAGCPTTAIADCAIADCAICDTGIAGPCEQAATTDWECQNGV